MTNDVLERIDAGGTLDSLIEDVLDGLRVMISQIRADWGAGVKIGWGVPPQARAPAADFRWGWTQAALRAAIGYLRQLGDANVHIINLHAHSTPTLGWQMSGTAAAATGVLAGPVVDDVHLGIDDLAAAREQAAEAIAAWIANVA